MCAAAETIVTLVGLIDTESGEDVRYAGFAEMAAARLKGLLGTLDSVEASR
jgi:hypothetical protein